MSHNSSAIYSKKKIRDIIAQEEYLDYRIRFHTKVYCLYRRKCRYQICTFMHIYIHTKNVLSPFNRLVSKYAFHKKKSLSMHLAKLTNRIDPSF
jgi:hypothetical protein